MKRLFIAALLALAGVTANATTINFDTIAGPSDFVGAQYQEDGFALSSNHLYSIGSDDAARYTGTTSLFSSGGDGLITLAHSGGRLFSLDSIDLDGFTRFPAMVSFLGIYSDGSGTSATFLTDSSRGLQRFAFDSSFANLVSVSWAQQQPLHSFDNIVVRTTEVPEPGMAAVFGLGLLALAAARRKSIQEMSCHRFVPDSTNSRLHAEIPYSTER